MKKIAQLTGITMLCLSLIGCSGDFFPVARDITNVQLMRVMALDKGEEERISVTVSGGVRPGDQGSEAQPPVILTWEAPTVFAACLTIQTYGDGYISYGHVGQCVLSADAAQEAVSDLLDFLERDFEMRVDTDLYVTTEGKAADLLTQVASKDKAATDRLDSIARDLPMESYGWPVSVRDFLIDIEDNGCAMAPVARLKEEEEEMTIACDNMCWFQDGKFGDELDRELSRAAAILTDNGKISPVEVTLSDGSVVGLRVTNVTCSWKLNWEGDVLTGAEAQINVKADLAELQGDADIYQYSVQQEMDEKLCQELEKPIQELLDLSQKEEADFLHLGRKFQVQCPARSYSLRENWDQWFPDLKLRIKVDGIVERSYDVNQAEETP